MLANHKPKIISVGIDLQIWNENHAFYRLSAEAKITHLSLHIEKICKELSQNAPDSLWIVSWREYGIKEPLSKFVSSQLKKLLKQKMHDLTDRYPQLVIISGATAFIKETHELSTLEKIKKNYEQELALNHTIKKNYNSTHQFQLEKNLAQTESAISNWKQDKGIKIVRNTSDLFFKNKRYGHDKSAPFWELPRMEYKPNPQFVFQLNKEKNKSCVIKFQPDSFEKPIIIGIEICREHFLGKLKEEITNSDTEIPDIHYIVSAHIDLNYKRLCGDYICHCDSERGIQFFKKNNSPSFEVLQYRYNLLQNQSTLEGPLENNFVLQLLNELNKLIKLLPPQNDKRKCLKLIKNQMLDLTENAIAIMKWKSFLSDAGIQKILKPQVECNYYEIIMLGISTINTLIDNEEQKLHNANLRI